MFLKIVIIFLFLFPVNNELLAQDSLDNSYLLELYQAGNHAEAARYLESSFPSSEDPQILNSLAYSYRMGGNLAAAEKAYQALYEQDTLSFPTMMNLANIYFSRGKINESSNLYQKALSVDSTNIKVYQRLSEVALRRNEMLSAYNYLLKANTINPVNADIAYNLGMAAINLKFYNVADSVILRALQDDPENINLLYGKAVTKEYLKQYPQGIETCEILLSLGSDSLQVLPIMGPMYYYNKDYDKTIETFLWLENELSELSEAGNYYLAASYWKTKEFKKGFDYIGLAIEQSLSGNTARYFSEMGEVQQVLNQYKPALASYKRSLIYEEKAITYYHIAILNDYYLKNEQDALTNYRRFIEENTIPNTYVEIREFVEGRIKEIQAP